MGRGLKEVGRWTRTWSAAPHPGLGAPHRWKLVNAPASVRGGWRVPATSGAAVRPEERRGHRLLTSLFLNTEPRLGLGVAALGKYQHRKDFPRPNKSPPPTPQTCEKSHPSRSDRFSLVVKSPSFLKGSASRSWLETGTRRVSLPSPGGPLPLCQHRGHHVHLSGRSWRACGRAWRTAGGPDGDEAVRAVVSPTMRKRWGPFSRQGSSDSASWRPPVGCLRLHLIPGCCRLVSTGLSPSLTIHLSEFLSDGLSWNLHAPFPAGLNLNL